MCSSFGQHRTLLYPKEPPEPVQLPHDHTQPSMRTEHSLSQAAELQVGVLEGLLHLLIQWLLLALQQYGGAAVQDAFGSTLHHQQVSVVVRVLGLVDG